MNAALWIAQVALAVTFLAQGYIKIAPPRGLPAPARWIYDLSPRLRIFIGAVELLGVAGLILPGLTRIRPSLTPLAALGFMLIMVLAIIFHLRRGEAIQAVGDVSILILSAFVAYGRWVIMPISGRQL